MALRRMAPRDLSRLPVVSRENSRNLLGMVRRNDIVRAYELGVTRRNEAQIKASEKRIEELSGLETAEIRIVKGSSCDSHRMSEIPWPRDCIIAAIRKGKRAIIPHGDALLHAGDVIVVVTEKHVLAEIRRLCTDKIAA
jgi:CIC family chloride channel protein